MANLDFSNHQYHREYQQKSQENQKNQLNLHFQLNKTSNIQKS